MHASTYLGFVQAPESFQQITQIAANTIQVLKRISIIRWRVKGFIGAYGIILESRHVGLHGLLHVSGRNKCRRQVDVAVDEVGLEAHCVAIILERLLELPTLLVNVAKVAVEDEQLAMALEALVFTPTCKLRPTAGSV